MHHTHLLLYSQRGVSLIRPKSEDRFQTPLCFKVPGIEFRDSAEVDILRSHIIHKKTEIFIVMKALGMADDNKQLFRTTECMLQEISLNIGH